MNTAIVYILDAFESGILALNIQNQTDKNTEGSSGKILNTTNAQYSYCIVTTVCKLPDVHRSEEGDPSAAERGGH